jgi:hypothetical protein
MLEWGLGGRTDGKGPMLFKSIHYFATCVALLGVSFICTSHRPVITHLNPTIKIKVKWPEFFSFFFFKIKGIYKILKNNIICKVEDDVSKVTYDV